MDTSEIYIKMCEKVEEIQKNWKPQVGDYIWRKYTLFGEEIDNQIWEKDELKEIIILHFQSSVDGYWSACNKDGEERIFKTPEDLYKKVSIWLPTQDRLQEIVWEGYDHIAKLHRLWELLNFAQKHYDNTGHFASMEQLWLAFVMKEKFNKSWDGNAWINL